MSSRTSTGSWRNAFAAARLCLAFARGVEPPPDRTPDKWADTYRIAGSDSPEPGPWRSERAVNTLALQWAVRDPRFRRVILVIDSQSGKTAAVFNIAYSTIDDLGLPVLYIGPTRSNVTTVISPKLDAVVAESDELAERAATGKSWTSTRKVLGGVTLRLAWGGKSTTELKADSAYVVIVDEADEFSADISGQGSIWRLADARRNAYSGGKTVGVSTCTVGNVETEVHPVTGLEHWKPAAVEYVPSTIWRAWQGGTRHEHALPCTECGEYFIPRRKLLTWPEDAEEAHEVHDGARLICPHCGGLIHPRHKESMRAAGVYVSPGQRPKAHEPGDELAVIVAEDGGEHPVRFGGYLYTGEGRTDLTLWSSGLASFNTTKTWGELAVQVWAAERSGEPEELKGVLNTSLAELFSFGGEAPAWETVAAKKAGYLSGEVPAGVGLLFLTVDVAEGRFDWVVRGWGREGHSWLIDQGELYCDTSEVASWDLIETLAERTYGGLSIYRAAIDSGYRRDHVYEFCKRDKRRFLPTKGELTLDRPFYAAKVQVNRQGRARRTSMKLWHVDTDRMKTWVHSRMGLDPKSQGQWRLPSDITEDYCRQIVAEQRVFEDGKIKWKKTGENHKFDCEVLQVFLARKEQIAIERATPVEAAGHVPPPALSPSAPTPAAVVVRTESVSRPPPPTMASDPYL